MKKQFFYAAFAIAMMASCTSEENFPVDPVNPTPEEEKVAIQLGIEAPSVNAEIGSRGTGSVGDVKGDKNKWNSQKLFITMINNATGDVANVDEQATTKQSIMAYNQFTYVAPRAEEQTTDNTTGASTGKIRIYSTYPAQGTGNEDKGTIQYLYYPVQGTFDFYGWHLDDATITASTTEAPNPKINAEAATETTASTTTIDIKGITIDGTQDIMGAKTVAPSNVPTDLQKWLYSARTARNEIDPTLKFEHKLARLKFFVKAGSHSAAKHNENGSEKQAPTSGEYANNPIATGAMFVTGITAKNLHSKFDMTLNNTGITTSNATTPIDFEVGSILKEDGAAGTADAGKKKGQIGSLVPEAPNYHKDYTGTLAQGVTKESVVGEPIMFLPVAAASGEDYGTEDQITFQLDLTQYVILTEDETKADGAADKYTYGPKTQSSTITVKATDVLLNNVRQSKFEAGKSYNIYITIYGFERIEVSAELTPWQLGGDVDVDIEDGTSSSTTQGSGTQTPAETVTATFNITGLAEGTTATVKLNDNTTATSSQATAEGTATATLTVNKDQAYTYTVEATGYQVATGDLSTTETAANFTEDVTMTSNVTAKEVTLNITWPANTDPIPAYTAKFTEHNNPGTVITVVDGKCTLNVGTLYVLSVESTGYNLVTDNNANQITINAETTEVTATMVAATTGPN